MNPEAKLKALIEIGQNMGALGLTQVLPRLLESLFKIFPQADRGFVLLKDPTGGQLTIKAPGIKGSEPDSDASIEDRVSWLLQTQINPSLAAHGGMVGLVEVTEEKEVILQFGGGCQGCGMADVTMKQGIEQTLTREIPEITAVKDVTDHDSGSNPYYASGAQGDSPV